jgi:2-oxoisovalerate dehydrogenase E1 component beta subunit
MVIRAPWGGGVHGALYHSQSIEATFAHIAGLKVVAPATPYDAKGLLLAAIRDPDPVLYLEHKRTYRLIKGEVPEGDYVVPIGTAAISPCWPTA